MSFFDCPTAMLMIKNLSPCFKNMPKCILPNENDDWITFGNSSFLLKELLNNHRNRTVFSFSAAA